MPRGPPKSKVKGSEKPVGADDGHSLVKSGGFLLQGSGSLLDPTSGSPSPQNSQDYIPSGPDYVDRLDLALGRRHIEISKIREKPVGVIVAEENNIL
ncbi:hypothetical protein WISP_80179 [Willisornis vidua]|uniref:Uncharacterized protein n=1 Tax=Willisornis vidua TaxID=1566151 RepID=A0ABQ9D9K0_9PASS|nr:hypothetical protein WISP_80179 [Willisornis vidua]